MGVKARRHKRLRPHLQPGDAREASPLAFAGVAISPALAAILMSVSTIVVALNAQLLLRLRLRLDPTTNH
ncbi:hypothetical protein [Paeniglutamicibacter sp.]|uniref:hypothetical protein n=1 Tax=Paeniglutamicibacter sp. TaxID=1934391 RepID=UPI0039894B6C